MQVISKSIRDLQSELQVTGYSKHCKSQIHAIVILYAAGETKFGNVRNNSIYQPLMRIAFGLQKQGFSVSRFCTP